MTELIPVGYKYGIAVKGGEGETIIYIYIIREEACASGGSRRLDLVMIYSQALYLCGLMSKGD